MPPNHIRPEYAYEPDGSFTVVHYNRAAPFSSFLPGIAGPWGIPMWVFYVNRGQGVCSFGVRDKDHAIAEFLPANWAYQLAFRQGFQTFFKIRRNGSLLRHEPFQMPAANDVGCVQTMRVWPGQVAFAQTHPGFGLEVEARYFTLPHEPVSALVRTVRVRNTGPERAELQMLDGLALIIPHGLNNYMLKNLRYIAQSQIEVTGLATRAPGFRTKASTEDSSVVEEVKGVNFCFGYGAETPHELLLPIVDPTAVFGASTDLSYPEIFFAAEDFRPPARQLIENQFPSALLLAEYGLNPGEERVFHSFYGHAESEDELAAFAKAARRAGFVDRKQRDNERLIEGLTQPCATVSSHEVLNAYARQNMLDNILRGGIPTTLSRGRKNAVLSLFARKHGDLERDYNYYIIEPTFCSQGEGNYRDVNQNRRHDVFMNPDAGADAVVQFMNLIQPDGYNPLHVKPRQFVCRKTPALRALLARAAGRSAPAVLEHVTRDFELGRLFSWMKSKSVSLALPREEFVDELLQHAEPVEDSEFGYGFWTDHWSYNLDLIETFRGIFPERLAELLFRRKEFAWCDSAVFVKPRSEKYVLVKGRPMQVDSIYTDAAKEALIKSRASRPRAVRTKHGKGEVYTSLLAPKLLGLAAIKLSSLDPFGVGIEMEADRPNWYDALNGLPAQFGSSISETLELKRLILFLQEALEMEPKGFRWVLPAELHALLKGLDGLLVRKPAGDAKKRAFAFWDAASNLRETYRARVRFGFDGAERTLPPAEVAAFLERALAKVNAGIAAARDRKTGLVHTYFRHDVTGYARGPKVGAHVTIRPTGFRQVKLPLFLEGQVHALRLETDARRARSLVRAVKQSSLFDKTLNMYKVNACLDREPKAIGRCRTFARGWLENESIWLHMEYKYLLEMLRAGLRPEFFEDFRVCAVPFMKPETYGRSVTENSSFIVSEAYPDPSLVGKGFMARLSGATAEFIHMWVVMCAGERPFRLDGEGKLEAVLEPALPAWLFTTKPSPLELVDNGRTETHEIPERAFAFVFLGRTLVTYVQEGAVRDTFGPSGARIRSLHLRYADGSEVEVPGSVLPEPHASALRNREIAEIRAVLA